MLTDVYQRFAAGEEVEVWPQRGTNAMPIAFNPNTGLVYIDHVEPAAHPEVRAVKPQVLGAELDRRHRPASRPSSRATWSVIIVAMNPLTGEMKWEVPLTDLPSAAGMLATDGGLALHRPADGRVHRARRGHRQMLWQFKTGSSVNATRDHVHAQGPAVRERRFGPGRQRRAAHGGDKVPTGGSMWTFALMPQ